MIASMRSMIAANASGIGISEAPRLGLVAAALARDHVGRDRPRALRQSRGSVLRGPSAAFTFANSLVNRLQPRRERLQLVERALDQRRRQPRPFAGDEAQILADRERHDQDVGKQDRRVESGKRRSGWSVTSAAASVS